MLPPAWRHAAQRTERLLSGLRLADAGHGYDLFGAHADGVRRAAAVASLAYERYFRVVSHGAENIPDGPAILAANHSGTLPYDGAMIWMDVLRNTQPPRLVRPIADWFVSRLPFLGGWFTRAGTVGGSRGNVRYLLEHGELILIFPEGTPGILKPFRERYRLRPFRVGHVEFAIRHRAPIIPVAVVGAEEQMPLIGSARVRPFGAPMLPIAATPIPLPVRYRIYYGEPLRFDREYSHDQADIPAVLADASARVQAAVAELIGRGLRERAGVFA